MGSIPHAIEAAQHRQALAEVVEALSATFVAKLNDRASQLARRTPQARQVLKKLLHGSIAFAPEPELYRFRANISVEQLLHGSIPGDTARSSTLGCSLMGTPISRKLKVEKSGSREGAKWCPARAVALRTSLHPAERLRDDARGRTRGVDRSRLLRQGQRFTGATRDAILLLSLSVRSLSDIGRIPPWSHASA